MTGEMNFTSRGYIWGMLVRKKKRAIPGDNPLNLPLVPAKYVEEALEYIAYAEAKDAEREE